MRSNQMILVLTGFLFATSAQAVDVTTVGQVVPKGKVGVLQTDLSCASPGVAVQLENGATLDMNGHVLDGCGVSASGPQPQRIAVRGPGTIRNSPYGIYLQAGSVRARDLTIEDSTYDGIVGSTGEANVRSTAHLKDVTITGSGQAAVDVTKVAGQRVTASGNAFALGVPAIIGRGGVAGVGFVVTGNASEGVFTAAGTLRLRNSQVTGNASNGVGGFKVSLAGSTVTGNNTSASANSADLVSVLPPLVKNSTCGTSLKSDLTGTWGVCTGD